MSAPEATEVTDLPAALSEPVAPVRGAWIGLLALANLAVFMGFFTPIQQLLPEQVEAIDPTRKETMVTTAMVFAMVFVAAAFFFLVDQALSAGVRLIFGVGH